MPIRVRPGVVWVPFARKTSAPYRGDGPPKALLHATITPSTTLPGYNNQKTAPHETMLWDPVRKVMKPRTHLYFDQYAKALQNEPGGVETNNDMVLQWELAGYLGSSTPRGEFDILEAPDIYWEQLADLIGDIVISWKVQNKFSRSYGAGISESNKAKRMSFSEWEKWNGFCTHADVPENHHWDSPLGARVRSILSNKIWPPPITPPPLPDINEASMLLFYQVSNDPVDDPLNKQIFKPVIMSDGYTMRWLSYKGWIRIKGAIKYNTGKNPFVVKVKDLEGVAVQWVGPIPPIQGGEYPIPDNVKIVT